MSTNEIFVVVLALSGQLCSDLRIDKLQAEFTVTTLLSSPLSFRSSLLLKEEIRLFPKSKTAVSSSLINVKYHFVELNFCNSTHKAVFLKT
jgi:hypothetical protein